MIYRCHTLNSTPVNDKIKVQHALLLPSRRFCSSLDKYSVKLWERVNQTYLWFNSSCKARKCPWLWMLSPSDSPFHPRTNMNLHLCIMLFCIYIKKKKRSYAERFIPSLLIEGPHKLKKTGNIDRFPSIWGDQIPNMT